MVGSSPAVDQSAGGSSTRSARPIRACSSPGRRFRQGTRRAAHSRAFAARRTARSSSSTRPPWRPRAWKRSCSASRRRGPAAARSARSKRRMAARSISTKSPTCRARRRPRSCACSSTRTFQRVGGSRAFTSTCASSPRQAGTSPRRSPRDDSARTCSIACRSCRSACPRSPSGARTFPSSFSISWSSLPPIWASRRARSAPTPWRCCSRTTGRAISASCATMSSG